MRIIFFILSLALVSGCVTISPRATSTSENGISRSVYLKETAAKYKIKLIFTDSDRKSVIAFTTPKSKLIETKDISNYTQHTTKSGRPLWSGGGFAGGFIFINRSFPPYYIEVHALELGDCSCRHVFPYFANGRYYIK
jgi:hypothetical protein